MFIEMGEQVSLLKSAVSMPCSDLTRNAYCRTRDLGTTMRTGAGHSGGFRGTASGHVRLPIAGIGHRLDGWANRDLNVGAIVAMAPI